MVIDKEISQNIKSKSEGYVKDQLKALEALSNIYCLSRNIEGNARVVEIIEEELKKFDCKIEKIHDKEFGTHIIARIKPENSKGKVIFSAHTDIAPVFQQEDIINNPFHIEGDWGYGIGVGDCKGGVLTSMYSVRIIQELGLLPDYEIVMIYNCDEEIGSPSAKKIFEREAVGADRGYIFEPSRDDNGIITERKGLAIFDMEFFSKTGHAAIAFEKTRSAAMELCRQAVRLGDAIDLDHVTYDVSQIVTKGTVADYAKARVGAAIRSEEGIERVKKAMKLIEEDIFIDGCSSKVTCNVFHPFMVRNKKVISMYNEVNKAGKHLGIHYPEQAINGASDGCLLSGYGLYLWIFLIH